MKKGSFKICYENGEDLNNEWVSLHTAVKTPLDLTKLDSEAASLKLIPSNLSLKVSPINTLNEDMKEEIRLITKHVFVFAFNLCGLHLIEYLL